jgi:hypothetical protein
MSMQVAQPVHVHIVFEICKSSRLTVQDIVCSATPDDLECRVYDICFSV